MRPLGLGLVRLGRDAALSALQEPSSIGEMSEHEP